MSEVVRDHRVAVGAPKSHLISLIGTLLTKSSASDSNSTIRTDRHARAPCRIAPVGYRCAL